MMMHACNHSYVGDRGRRILVQGQPRQKHKSTSKTKALSSNPNTAKKKKKKDTTQEKESNFYNIYIIQNIHPED
jgi:hypothetical protein